MGALVSFVAMAGSVGYGVGKKETKLEGAKERQGYSILQGSMIANDEDEQVLQAWWLKDVRAARASYPYAAVVG